MSRSRCASISSRAFLSESLAPIWFGTFGPCRPRRRYAGSVIACDSNLGIDCSMQQRMAAGSPSGVLAEMMHDQRVGSEEPAESIYIADKSAHIGAAVLILAGLTGIATPNGNHAKIGVSTSGDHHYSIFGDMNQQGSLSPPKCDSSQNGRGGLFYVIDDKTLASAVTDLIKGESAPAPAASKAASN